MKRLFLFHGLTAALMVGALAEDYTLSGLSITPQLTPMTGGDYAMEAPVIGDRSAMLVGGDFTMENTVTPLPSILVLGEAAVFITMNGGQAVVTWFAPGAGYVLESSTTLGALAIWLEVNPTPGESRLVVTPALGSPQFFRLRRE